MYFFERHRLLSEMEVPSPRPECPERKIQDRVDELIGFIDAGKVIIDISPEVEDFCGTGIEIWAGFGPKKRSGPIMNNF